MFIVLLKFSEQRHRVDELMDGHRHWLHEGMNAGIFLLAGSLQPGLGGAIVASNTTLPDLQRRVDEDPFVAAGVVTAEILEITPSLADERLRFLVAQ